MNDNDKTNEDQEKELDKAFCLSERKKNVFQIMRDENESLDNKEQRIKKKFNS